MLHQMKLPQIQAIMREFEKQSEIMDMKEEMMSDAIDDALGDEEDEEERLVGPNCLKWVSTTSMTSGPKVCPGNNQWLFYMT